MTAATLTIDLAALRANWRKLADKAAPAECAAVVKADAYGCGIEPCVRALRAEGARVFFVARLSEGIRARAAAPEAVIYVLDGLTPGSGGALRAAKLRPTLCSMPEIVEWAASGGGPAALHFDTGMNRLGLAPSEAGAALAALGAPPTLVMSHFISSEIAGSPDNARQIEAFEHLRSICENVPLSISNSSGIFLSCKPFFHLVRPGYALYGGNPTPDAPNPMRPVVALDVPILQTRRIEPGDRVGYNGQWTAPRPTRIAVIAAGYADGIPRGASGTGARPGVEVAVGGKRCPIVGRVSMDLIAIDATDAPDDAVTRGASVELLGATVGVDEFGERSGTIGYEILTGLGRRYERVYRD
ncbi:MAG: alanine racemase [Hyphomicrobiales bacterium]|nr:alanine racemase [Hyphomicrobiales bacterium]